MIESALHQKSHHRDLALLVRQALRLAGSLAGRARLDWSVAAGKLVHAVRQFGTANCEPISVSTGPISDEGAVPVWKFATDSDCPECCGLQRLCLGTVPASR